MPRPPPVKSQTSTEDRYFITSNTGHDMEKIAAAVRAHGQVENSLHWVLDIAFCEDQCRTRMGYAAENHATIRKMALNAIKTNKSKKGGVKAKLLQGGWDNDYLRETLMAM